MSAAADAVPVARQVKEKFGTLRFYVDGATEEQYAYIAFAEALTARTCEVCGAQGERREEGWVRTLCYVHQAERLASLPPDDPLRHEGGKASGPRMVDPRKRWGA